MIVSAEAQRRLSDLRRRAGKQCIGFRFQGAIGTCRGSSPVLKPVTEPPAGAAVFHVGDVALFAQGDYAEILGEAQLDYDGALFGRGLTVTWTHRGAGCPNCR